MPQPRKRRLPDDCERNKAEQEENFKKNASHNDTSKKTKPARKEKNRPCGQRNPCDFKKRKKNQTNEQRTGSEKKSYASHKKSYRRPEDARKEREEKHLQPRRSLIAQNHRVPRTEKSPRMPPEPEKIEKENNEILPDAPNIGSRMNKIPINEFKKNHTL
ncbi:MAG: hypothetical protein HY006_00360 [Candidatus Sungbacteria bacterium]|nr:hypothetical protein [Candidatus Sungbacteria bacterium]